MYDNNDKENPKLDFFLQHLHQNLTKFLQAPEQLNRTMDVNFFGVVTGCRTFLPLLTAQKWSALVIETKVGLILNMTV